MSEKKAAGPIAAAALIFLGIATQVSQKICTIAESLLALALAALCSTLSTCEWSRALVKLFLLDEAIQCATILCLCLESITAVALELNLFGNFGVNFGFSLHIVEFCFHLFSFFWVFNSFDAPAPNH